MTIKYIADDGKTFDNFEECVAHEKLLGFKMLGEDGKAVKHFDDAIAIWIFEPIGLDHFFCAISEDGYSSDEDIFKWIVDRNDCGLYIWDDWTETFVFVDSDRFEPYRKIFELMTSNF